MQKIIKKLIKNKSGLSLVELLAVIFVFSVTISASMAVAATYLKGNHNLKNYQKNSEELSVVMNYISKDIRMSNSLKNITSDHITLKSNRDASNSDITYAFNGSDLRMNGIAIAGNVSGNFSVENSAGIPLITIVIWKNGYPEFSVETAVSMRSGYK